jgi:hypothetical protein
MLHTPHNPTFQKRKQAGAKAGTEKANMKDGER